MNREQLIDKINNCEFDFGNNSYLDNKVINQIADIAQQYAQEQIEETAKNGIVELMESIPQKVALWMVFQFGRECVKCNADTLELSEEADIKGNRYLIKTVITIEKI